MAKGEGTRVQFDNRTDVKTLVDMVEHPAWPKSVKQAALTRIRELEQRDGKDYYPSFNGVSRNPSEMARRDEETMGDLS